MSAKSVGVKTMQDVWDFMGEIGKKPNIYAHCWGWKDEKGRVQYDCVLSIKACGWGVDDDITNANKYDYIAKNKTTMPDVGVGSFYKNSKVKSMDMAKIPKDKISFVYKADMSHIGIYNPSTGMTREVCAGTVMGYREMPLSGYWEAWSTGCPYYTDSNSNSVQNIYGYLDSAKLSSNKLSVSGWTYGGNQTVDIRVIKGNDIALSYTIKADKDRPDVQSAMGYPTSKVGYSDSREIKLASGNYVVKAYANGTELINFYTITIKATKTTTKTTTTASKPNPRTYKVQKGDSLWTIAVKFYGNGSRWGEIQKANNLKDTLIITGQTLIIP